MSPEERSQKERKKEDEKRELMATVLADSVFAKDKEVAAKYGIDEKTVQNYRRRLASDPLLRGVFDSKIAALEAGWVREMPRALREGLETQRAITRNLRDDPDFQANPGALKEVAQANLAVAEIYLTWLSVKNGAGNTPSQGREEQGQVRGDGAGDESERVF